MATLRADHIDLIYPLRAGSTPKFANRRAEADRFVRDPSGRATGLKALSDIDFRLTDGERLALVGRNGSGKSTLLRVLGGVLPPDSGQVYADGSMRGIFNLQVGAQAAATGRENIVLSGLVAGASRAEIAEREAEIVDFAELDDFIDMPFASYSAGMKMRLLFATATAFAPDILILDEWLSAGDAPFREKAKKRMSEMVAQSGVLVLASHQRSLLRDVCTKALWLHDGRMRMYGPVDDVLEAYDVG
ncbi:MAG: ABC transporter ATP-binding protein [Pseudomonadota bacterium]